MESLLKMPNKCVVLSFPLHQPPALLRTSRLIWVAPLFECIVGANTGMHRRKDHLLQHQWNITDLPCGEMYMLIVVRERWRTVLLCGGHWNRRPHCLVFILQEQLWPHRHALWPALNSYCSGTQSNTVEINTGERVDTHTHMMDRLHREADFLHLMRPKPCQQERYTLINTHTQHSTD